MKSTGLVLVATLLVLPTWQGRFTAVPVGAAAMVPSAGLPAVPGAPARGVQLADGLLSVDALEIDVAELLAEIARQAGFEFRSSMAAPDRVSLRFARLPLDQGLLLILSGQSYTLKWSDSNAPPGARQPASLWVFDLRAETSGRVTATATTEITPDAVELLAALRHGTPQEREQAAADLGQLLPLGQADPAKRAGSEATTMRALAAALADSDPQVRLAAIESLGAIGGDAAALALEVALRDLEPRVREAAVDALGDIGAAAALALLKRARADEVDYVREAADEAIERRRLPAHEARRPDVNAGAVLWSNR
jgi:HEAT repeats